MSLITTVAGASANSYSDADYADAYFCTTGREARWRAILDRREGALYDGMLFIEAQNYVGSRATMGQALEFPRVGGYRIRRMLGQGFQLIDYRGRIWTSDAIPPPIKNAQCEMALILGEDESWLSGDMDTASIRTGVVTVSGGGSSRRGLVIPSAVMLWLDGFLLQGGSTIRLMKC